MRGALLIAGRELASYARTPSGYVVAAVVLGLDGLLFNGFALGAEARPSAEVLSLFFYVGGVGTMVAGILLSMRLLAEEHAQGTDVLLLTSPVREHEIVLGKFLASFAFLAVLALLTFHLATLVFVHGKVSLGHLAAGYLGMLLLGASTLALGTFASALTPHPFSTVLLTAALVGALDPAAYLIGQVADPPVGPVLGYLALHSTHFGSFQRGLVRLSDVVFHASVVYLALLAATRVLEARRWR
ncbi:MAG TPA: ABC transporter permease [Sandaracinaceae bacterium LLY-WYZ-13_1]|nr:ABC transporter permease [Sandaracinaceae bacterium LLY-WYZ-13_1]